MILGFRGRSMGSLYNTGVDKYIKIHLVEGMIAIEKYLVSFIVSVNGGWWLLAGVYSAAR